MAKWSFTNDVDCICKKASRKPEIKWIWGQSGIDI